MYPLTLMTNMADHRLIITRLLVLLMSFHSHAFLVSSKMQYPPQYTGEGVRSAYWPAGDDFSPSSIDTKYFNHILYAFIELKPDSFKLDITESDKKWITKFINGLHNKSPPVKTLLSIGGGASNATLFSIMASNKQNRANFIDSTIQVARQYGLDGLDLDWEFPADEKDMANLGLLFKEWHQALVVDSKVHKRPRLLLTAAVYYASTIKLIGNGPRSYPAQAITQYLDWASPMSFDYHGAWANITGYNAALYDPKSNISTHYGIGSWIKSGVRPESWLWVYRFTGGHGLQDPNDHRPGATAVGPATDTDGTLNYDEILEFNKENGATVVYDGLAVSYYSYAGTTWISYDDGPSITKKVQFARSLRLKGYFIWALGKDKDWTISRQASKAWGY